MMIKAMILAAGLGKRLAPFTDHKPKALAEINGQTLLEMAIIKLKQYGIQDIIINTHHFSAQIVRFLEEKEFFHLNIQYTVEKELLDSGGGIKNAHSFLHDSVCFLVYNVDIISEFDIHELLEYHLKKQPLATLAASKRKSTRYLLFDESGQLCGWENTLSSEKIITVDSGLTLSQFGFSGIHVISPDIFQLMPEVDTFSIIDCYLLLAPVHRILLFEHQADQWFDVGKTEELQRVALYLSLKK